jgi:hypothetical protein
MSSHLYLVKESDDLVSHCTCDCDAAYVTYPGQMDCPWCGCGWLFTCINCRKAFTFAKAVEVPESWEDIARRDLTNGMDEPPTDEEIHDWVEMMQLLMADLEEGEVYVYLDGHYIPAGSEGAEFDGWYADHNLEFLPQVEALDDESLVDSVLANPDYWNERRIEEE